MYKWRGGRPLSTNYRRFWRGIERLERTPAGKLIPELADGVAPDLAASA